MKLKKKIIFHSGLVLYCKIIKVRYTHSSCMANLQYIKNTGT